MRRISIFTLLLMCLTLWSRRAQADFGTNWTAIFYNNTNFSGAPADIINGINGINFNWPHTPIINSVPVAGVDEDNFSVRFTSTQNIAQGSYQFTVTYDEHVRVVVDGNVEFEDYVNVSIRTYSFFRDLTAGQHSLQVELIDFTSQAVIQLQWNPTLSSPQLFAPSNGATMEDTTPTFSWSAVPSAVEYQIQIDNNNNFFSPEREATTTNRQYTPITPLPLGSYYWRVRATNSAWSAVRQFTIELLRPRLNYFITSDVLLTWNPISWAESYVVQISRNLAFTDLVETIPSADIFVEYVLSNGTYYWRVRALATDQTGKWSVAEQITVDMP
jgi:hypothetical protein